MATNALVQEGLLKVDLSVDLSGSGPEQDTGTWDTFEGGSIRAPSRTYRPGGAEPELTVGFPVVDEITVTRSYRAVRDGALEASLVGAIGRRCTVKKVVLDPSTKQPTDVLRVFKGRLTGVTTPRARSDGGDEVAMLSVTVGVEGLPT